MELELQSRAGHIEVQSETKRVKAVALEERPDNEHGFDAWAAGYETTPLGRVSALSPALSAALNAPIEPTRFGVFRM